MISTHPLFHRRDVRRLNRVAVVSILAKADWIIEGDMLAEKESASGHAVPDFSGSAMISNDLSKMPCFDSKNCSVTYVNRFAHDVSRSQMFCEQLRFSCLAQLEGKVDTLPIDQHMLCRIIRLPKPEIKVFDYRVRNKGTTLLIDIDIVAQVFESQSYTLQ